MKAQTKKRTNVLVAAMVVVAALAIAFWMLLLSPEREEAQRLDGRIQTLEASLAQDQAEAAAGEAARRSFAADYSSLVVLGKAVPGGDETASLLVQLNHLSARTGVSFNNLTLSASSSGTEETPTAVPGAALSPTEAEASLMPLGASIGPAGLAVMPYTLAFEGSFFEVAQFIEGLDNLVKTSNEGVSVNGRLITVNSFSLSPAESEGRETKLQGTFSVTTFLTAPGQGLTGGATAAGPEEAEPVSLTSTTTGTEP